MRVLIVDDEHQIRRGIMEGLDWASLGFEEISGAANGSEAMERIRLQRPDLVITDIKMPVMDGLELSRHIKALDSGIRIVILSGYEEFDYARQALQLGVRHYELKPIKLNNFLKLLQEIRQELEEERTNRAKQAEMETRLSELAKQAELAQDKQTAHNPEQTVARYSPAIANAILYMKNHLQEPLSVEKMAELAAITPNYFSHLFKKETGVTFSDFMSRIRVEEARKLLITTNMMIYEISERVGFLNYKYFIAVFRKVTGVSPSEARRLPEWKP